ncbi:phospholipid carrier-dependent glycosyltransferase [Patescibacteria group bacterium]|nr:phospholipid carrier-dependent glycosyltransferase [Patescibacteria group bacterium]
MLTTIKKNYLLILVLLLAFFVRAYKITSYPALNADEAALGYNAYSLIKTGHDEHGHSWPLHFKSFGDYKPGGYVYLALPFIATLGLNPLAVRLPNLILSTFSVFILYRLILLVSKNKKLALLSALLLAISPWHIHFSRGAWESSAALSFILFAVYYFYRQKFSLSIVFFVLSTYIYHSARIISPLLLLSLFITNYKLLITNYKKLLLPLFIGVFLTIPIALSFLHSGGTARLGGVGITADPGPLSRSEELLNQHANVRLINRAMHNKKVLYLISWAEKYFSHFDLNFLFVNGDEVPRSKVPDMGQLYLLELPFLLLGLITLIRKPRYHQLKTLLLPWLFIAPLASSLTFQAPSALRALSLSIPLIVITALGLLQVTNYKLQITIILFYLFSFFYYLNAYFIHYPKRLPLAWPYGFKELSLFLKQYPYPPTQPIYITNKYDQPYILMTLFDQTSPQQVQSQIKLTPPDQYGFSTVATLGHYHFQKIDWDTIPSGSLVVASDETIPNTPFYTIDFPNGQKAFKIYLKP